MLIDEEALMLEKDRQDLYTAHEIIQLLPIFERDNIYNKFMNANRWVKKFLPNAVGRIKKQESGIKKGQKKSLFLIHNSLFIFEKLAKTLQLWYMKKHRTKETVESHFLAFHPFDYRDYVLKEYNKRLKRYEV